MSDLSDKAMVVAPFKSSLAAILLSLVSGPIGLLYINWIHSLIMLVITLILFSIPFPKEVSVLVFAVIWLVCIYWAGIDVLLYNKRLMKKLVK